MVTNPTTRFDQTFLETKREQLNDLREKLLATRATEQAEQAEVNAGSSGEAREYEDDAQKLVTLELQGTLEARDTARLTNVERALRKIEEGTYGMSDASGDAIPLDRLDAMPEAIYTLVEQSALDKKS